MSKWGKRKPGRIVGALDTESSTLTDCTGHDVSVAILYQLAYTGGDCVSTFDLDAIEVTTWREQSEIAPNLVKVIRDGIKGGYTPVIAVHNLAYDLRYLMEYLQIAIESEYSVTCCFKSSVKPLNVSIVKGHKALITFWDTLTFSGMGLARMGGQCGYAKATGKWDYQLMRTPITPLTDDEREYASRDVVALLHWLRFWCDLNPEVPPELLGVQILTKTSVVRYKTRKVSSRLKKPVARKRQLTVYGEYLYVCKAELPADERTYSLMIRSTGAGWAFTAGESAGIAFSNCLKFDAKSMHPSHMVSHYYPRQFELLNDERKRLYVLSHVGGKSVDEVLSNWVKPFDYAFNARILFKDVRLKRGSVFERDGVALHGQGLFKDYDCQFADLDDESSNREFNAINADGYANYAVNPFYLFGKLVSADEIVISLSELNFWVHCQVYEWDSLEVLDMSATANFRKAPDHVFVSVAEMLMRKSYVKDLMRTQDAPRPDWMPEKAYADILENPKSDDSLYYYDLVKADLNSLYGIFATNEFRQSISYIEQLNTFDYTGERGIENAPSKPKAWYQFGMRVATWSRVQQCIAMILLDRGCVADAFINGDTDSIAFEAVRGCTLKDVSSALSPLHDAIGISIRFCAKTLHTRPESFEGLGEYELDCTPELYCAVANKRYAYTDQKGVHVASAGMPVTSVRAALEYELENGMPFDVATIKALGYEVEYVGELSGTKARNIPGWGQRLEYPALVEDYRGVPYIFEESQCVGIALHDTSKILGAGYMADYSKCCDNANVPLFEPRHYERVTDTEGHEKIGVW